MPVSSTPNLSVGVARAGTMSEPLDELYLTWLYSQVDTLTKKNPSHTHWKLLKQLYTKEFIWIVPNDDNRLEDGRDLRQEFVEDTNPDVDSNWMNLGCSMLEMLVALARRLSFETGRPVRNWFWEFLFNLHIVEYTDDSDYPDQDIDEILETVIWRTYDRDGHGGLFPLHRAEEDQRYVEIWYQQSYYLAENGEG